MLMLGCLLHLSIFMLKLLLALSVNTLLAIQVKEGLIVSVVDRISRVSGICDVLVRNSPAALALLE